MCDHKYDNIKYKSHLIVASEYGCIDCVNALIAAGASIDLKDIFCQTALMFASQDGHIDCVNALIAAGASIDLKEQSGQTALQLASQNGQIECVNALKTASEKSQKSSNKTPAEIPANVSTIDAKSFKFPHNVETNTIPLSMIKALLHKILSNTSNRLTKNCDKYMKIVNMICENKITDELILSSMYEVLEMTYELISAEIFRKCWDLN